MRFIRSSLFPCAALFLIAACHRTQAPRGGGVRGPGDPTATVLPTPAGQPMTATTKPNASRKRVEAKEEPATLIAADRSECTVTATRFRDTKVGDAVVCDWRSGDRKP